MSYSAFVLGAGATRGCSFVKELQAVGHSIPPLDGDYFTQLQRVIAGTEQVLIRRLMKSMVEWFGPNFSVGMETVFTHVEHMERMAAHLHKKDDEEKLSSFREDLKQSIATVLGDSLTHSAAGNGSYRLRECEFHDTIVEDLANKGDSFVSFNYDCVLDDSLKRKGAGKWNPKFGYGFKLRAGGQGISGIEKWQPSGGLVSRKETIRVHKVHGSLHFKSFSDREVALKSRPFSKPNGKKRKFEIVAPESQKVYETKRYGEIMKGAAKDLRSASRLVVIGYSLPATDQHAESLFRLAAKSANYNSVVVVNPDPIARRRIRSAVQAGIKPDTRVLSFDTLEQFVRADARAWSEA